MCKISLVVFVMLAGGCGGKEQEAKATGGSAAIGSATGASGSATAPKPGTVQISVDDEVVATVDAAKIAGWPRLDSLVPEPARRLGKWQAIQIKGAKPAMSVLNKPFETYRDYVPALFPADDGTVSFGMFDPVELGKKGKPALREDGVVELHVKLDAEGMRGGNDHGGGQAIDPANVELVIKTKTGEVKLSGEKLLGLPREPMPGGGGDAKGWQIPTVLDAAGVKTWTKLRLHDAKGMSLTLERAELVPGTIPFLKLNRQGALRYRLYKQKGEGWQPAGDLRSLIRIEILE